MDEPATEMPEASPRLREANHAASIPITDTLLAPLPMPVNARQAAAERNPLARPVSTIPTPPKARPTEITFRGP